MLSHVRSKVQPQQLKQPNTCGFFVLHKSVSARPPRTRIPPDVWRQQQTGIRLKDKAISSVREPQERTHLHLPSASGQQRGHRSMVGAEPTSANPNPPPVRPTRPGHLRRASATGTAVAVAVRLPARRRRRRSRHRHAFREAAARRNTGAGVVPLRPPPGSSPPHRQRRQRRDDETIHRYDDFH